MWELQQGQLGDLRAAVVTQDHTPASSNKHEVGPCTFSHP